MRRRLGSGIVALALLLGACGDDGGTDEAASTTAPTTAVPTTAVPTTAVPTTAVPTTAVPTTAVPTTAVPTTAVPTTAVPTTAVPTTAVVAPGPPYPVVSSTRTFVDDTRPTPATAVLDQQPTRTLEVWIDRPDTDEVRPLVVFAHGLTGHPRSHERLRTELAADGFVVAAPAFPLTNTDVSGAAANAGDVTAQMGDVRYLIDAVLGDPELGPLVDGDRIGVVGHSLGGLTTAGVVSGPQADARVKAAVIMSAGGIVEPPEAAVLLVHGDADPVVPIAIGRASYDTLSNGGGDRMFVTLVGGDHTTGILDDDSDFGVATRGILSAFLAQALDVDPGERSRVAAIEALPLDAVTIEAGVAGGARDWRDLFLREG